MHTLKLKIDDRVYDQFLTLLNKFTTEEVEIVMDEPHSAETKKYLQSELDEINIGEAKFLSVNEAEQQLERLIKKHETSQENDSHTDE